MFFAVNISSKYCLDMVSAFRYEPINMGESFLAKLTAVMGSVASLIKSIVFFKDSAGTMAPESGSRTCGSTGPSSPPLHICKRSAPSAISVAALFA